MLKREFFLIFIVLYILLKPLNLMSQNKVKFISLEKNPQLLIKPEITIKNCSVYGYFVGQNIDGKISDEYVDIMRVGFVLSPDIDTLLPVKELYGKLKERDGFIYIKNNISINVKNGIVKYIDIKADFWKNYFDLNQGKFKEYFGVPDFEFDNFTADYYSIVENFYDYHEKGIEVVELDENKEITSIRFMEKRIK